ncbi:hypothetical protein Tco_1401113 [Tanacetum coccineum]
MVSQRNGNRNHRLRQLRSCGRLCRSQKHKQCVHIHGMLSHIVVLRETNRPSHFHHRSRVRICRKSLPTSLMDEKALVDYDIKLDDVPVLCDNKGAIDLIKNPVLHSCTKHIEIRHHFLRDNVQKGNISIEKVSFEDNIADILIKPLKREPFNFLRLGLGLMEPNA